MKPSFHQLTDKQKQEYGNGCGMSAKFLNVPDFIFTASCTHHDFNYERGGTPLDKIKADWDFYRHMLKDSTKLWHYFVSTVYFVGVAFNPISWIAFSYGPWKTIEEILERDKRSKMKR